MKLFVSKNIVLEEYVVSGGVVVSDDGKVVKILTEEECGQVAKTDYDEIHDENDRYIMAGVIDSHVHINEPGRTTWEGFNTATMAAAAGGITTIVDMPLNSIPPTTTLQNFRCKIGVAKEQIHVDVAFWGGVIPGNENELLPLINAGVVGFKCFMCPSGVEEFPHVSCADIEVALQKLEGTTSVLAFHAELESSREATTDGCSGGDPTTYTTFLQSRPATMEINAIKQIIDLSTKYKTRLHIVHLSASEALPLIETAKKSGANMTVETCHHYLSLTAEQVPEKGTQFKCCPPIRDAKNQEKLWDALSAGTLDMVVSDHSPCTPDLKLLSNCNRDDDDNVGDFMKAWGGISSVQLGLSLFWTRAKARGFALHDVGRYLTRATAKLVGLQSRKGQISAGYDADFVVWDPNAVIEINRDMIRHKNKITPYFGVNLCGKIHKTVVRGHIVYEDGKPFGKPIGTLLIN